MHLVDFDLSRKPGMGKAPSKEFSRRKNGEEREQEAGTETAPHRRSTGSA
jgi:hypothetical protein